MVISKELLSEVLGEEITEICYITDSIWLKNSWHKVNRKTEITYRTQLPQGGSSLGLFNIHELALDKCMEWMNNQGYYITTDVTLCGIGNFIVKINKMLTVVKYHDYPFEIEKQDIKLKPEHIFECCQWIMENKND